MTKLTEIIARGQPCALRFYPPCDDSTVVPCHLPAMRLRGMGMKTPDLFAVPGCRVCHDLIDRRDSRWMDIPPAEREQRMRLALMETLARLWEEGVIGRVRK